MEQIVNHTLLGFCWWDIPAAIIFVGIVVFLIVRHIKLKNREKNLQEAINGYNSNTEGDDDKGILEEK